MNCSKPVSNNIKYILNLLIFSFDRIPVIKKKNTMHKFAFINPFNKKSFTKIL